MSHFKVNGKRRETHTCELCALLTFKGGKRFTVRLLKYITFFIIINKHIYLTLVFLNHINGNVYPNKFCHHFCPNIAWGKKKKVIFSKHLFLSDRRRKVK